MSHHRILAVLGLAGLSALVSASPVLGRGPQEGTEDPWAQESQPPVAFHGFVEIGGGTRLNVPGRNDTATRRATLEELRLRLELERDFTRVQTSFKVDLTGDGVGADDAYHKVRQAQVSLSLGDFDLRLGRQVLTWGTGDLVFLNDLFPKDWISFFAGRERSYLKYPSDSLKVSLYKPAINVDFVWTPVFAPDRFLTGERFSYFSPTRGTIVQAPPALDPVAPSSTAENGELALRLYKTLGSYELALYGYRGFFKQPRGFDAVLGRPIFPPLSVYGASVRGPAWGGIANAEVAWHDSRDDRRGDAPLLPNSQYRVLVGHERELVKNLTLGLQYYLEGLLDHGRLRAGLPASQVVPEKLRHVLTTRWTYRRNQDKLTLSLFAFLSPSARDWYLIPSFAYRMSDRWQWDAGLNLFGGKEPHTFLGQFEDNTNVFLRLRRSF